jgi:DNA (cytosine-5)-methyltransferase 1
LELFAQPVTVATGGGTYERPGSGYQRTWPALTAPLRTRTGTAGDGYATPPPVVINVNHHGDNGRPYPPEAGPLGPRTTRIGDGIATPAFYVKNYGATGQPGYLSQPLTTPLGAITTSDSHSLIATPAGPDTAGGAPFVTVLRANSHPAGVDEPLAALTTGRNHALTTPPEAAPPAGEPVMLLIPYRRRARARPTSEPLHTLTTRDSAGLCTPNTDTVPVEVVVEDCYFRMLKPREHLRGQRFPDTYQVKGNKGEQTRQAGNAVSANVAHWVGCALAEVLGGGTGRGGGS